MTDNTDNPQAVDGSIEPAKSKSKLIKRSIIAVILVIFVYFAGRVGQAAWVFYKHGIFDAPTGDRIYHGDRIARLQALRTALMAYQTSEGQFPDASGWMDAITNRIQSDDMATQQSDRKLRDPAVSDRAGYGFGFNSALSNKYIGDIKNQDTTVLIYTSKDTAKNAQGDPNKSLPEPPRGGENLGITVSGKVIKLKGS